MAAGIIVFIPTAAPDLDCVFKKSKREEAIFFLLYPNLT
ncbi:hypothetical protein DSUL_20048 [Desulfovibrionales bacterium]